MRIIDDIKAKAEWLYGSSSRKNFLKATLTDGTMAMILYRMMQACQRHGLSPMAAILGKLNAIFCRCIIGRHADFGPVFVLIHSEGVVINSKTRGGSRIYVEHQVTIGAERNETPALGNDIFVGAGAKIVGGITIGDHARVGANAVVVKDVPEYATVGGIPARVLRMRSPDNHDSPPPVNTDIVASTPDLALTDCEL